MGTIRRWIEYVDVPERLFAGIKPQTIAGNYNLNRIVWGAVNSVAENKKQTSNRSHENTAEINLRSLDLPCLHRITHAMGVGLTRGQWRSTQFFSNVHWWFDRLEAQHAKPHKKKPAPINVVDKIFLWSRYMDKINILRQSQTLGNNRSIHG